MDLLHGLFYCNVRRAMRKVRNVRVLCILREVRSAIYFKIYKYLQKHKAIRTNWQIGLEYVCNKKKLRATKDEIIDESSSVNPTHLAPLH
jgi:hypothetical protein